MFQGFETFEIDLGPARIFCRRGGSGAPILLLHGFPECHLMWRDIAPGLTREHTVVCADLRGYGKSSCPPSDAEHVAYSKRAMAADMVDLMDRLGFSRFCVAGHDRGGRVAQRLALDWPEQTAALAVLDVVPVMEAWDRADDRLALSFWPWSLLAQAEPLPETILVRCATEIVDHAAANWGSPASMSPAVRAHYSGQLRDPMHAHAICEEYRAAASVDRTHDRNDRAIGRMIECPTLVLWSAAGPLSIWYEEDGGPIGIWRGWCSKVTGHAMQGGHFFPEERPEETTAVLSTFFA